ncbi:hypothetical protein [Tranquillimonas alkanivorans]|uniref:Uncharacterized protein n=1 Tax=Tranquillimonas alkanivorans TaxID=441119 RepID=A0A1I5TTR6_9RHOB|nr:hypothetical protein [Tranquillimonas alkanivorans]SFP86462.1 hypothetical protein SAMN04488047_11525 [Tranquillimonas alkanivorans]
MPRGVRRKAIGKFTLCSAAALLGWAYADLIGGLLGGEAFSPGVPAALLLLTFEFALMRFFRVKAKTWLLMSVVGWVMIEASVTFSSGGISSTAFLAAIGWSFFFLALMRMRSLI